MVLSKSTKWLVTSRVGWSPKRTTQASSYCLCRFDHMNLNTGIGQLDSHSDPRRQLNPGLITCAGQSGSIKKKDLHIMITYRHLPLLPSWQVRTVTHRRHKPTDDAFLRWPQVEVELGALLMYSALRLAACREVPSDEGGDTSQGTSVCALTNASFPLYCIVWYHNRGLY